jgi:hypothetical protein
MNLSEMQHTFLLIFQGSRSILEGDTQSVSDVATDGTDSGKDIRSPT